MAKILSQEVLEYRQHAQWYRTKSSTLAVALNKILKENSITEGVILDAGASFGLDTCYFARKGFNVVSVDINPGAIPYILENIKKYKVGDTVEVINKPIQDVVKQISDQSLVGVIDVGMSHSLGDIDKKKYAEEVYRVLKFGGFFVLSHFSEYEEENPAMGRSQEYLSSLFPESRFEIIYGWKENRWTSLKTGKLHSAWLVIFRKIFV